MRSVTLGLAVAAGLMVAGCGGGSSGSTPSVGSGSGSGTSTVSENAIATTNALGTPMNSLSNYNSVTSSLQSVARSTESVQLGVCQTTSTGGSYEFYSPDKNGDANSTEQQYFYDTGCTQVARDIVRVWSSTGSASETVIRTSKIYAQGNATAIATRMDSDSFANATFDQYGFPIPADGFVRTDTGALQYSGANAVASDDELVMNAVSGGTEAFCGDAAGYSVSGIAALGETFGWQGGVLAGGTRTLNGDGSVTWNATHAGTTSKGAIGSLSIGTGTGNTTCPITAPMFTLTGGTAVGAYSIPAVATYKSGLLIGLTITNATLAGGNTLNVTTNTAVSPTSSGFISGVIANAGAQVATFSVDAFGDGTLTISSSGTQYVITDWHVVK
jgi:hypothetical protein